MTTPALVVMLSLAVALAAGGAVAAFTSTNALKKIVAALTALMGAAFATAALEAPSAALLAASVVAFAYAVIGVAVATRIQEAYGSVETDDLDAADEQDEPQEREP